MLALAIEMLAAARSRDRVIEILRGSARAIVGSAGIAIVLRDEDQCRYVAEDAMEPLWQGLSFPAAACVSGWAMERGQTAVIADVFADARVPHAAYRKTFVKSMAMVPIGRPATAAIGAYWAAIREPSEEELALLEALSRSASTALENVRLLDALASSERQLRAVFESDAVGLALYDPAQRTIPLVNDRFLQLADLSRTELIEGSRGFADATAPEFRESDEAARLALAQGQRVEPYEKAFVRRNGTRQHVLLAAEAAGDPALTVVTVQDIEPIRALHQELRTSEERLRLVTETIKEVFYVYDTDEQRLEYLSPAFETIWGIDRAEALESSVSVLDAVDPGDRASIEEARARHLLGEATDIEYRVSTPAGIRWIRDRAFPSTSGGRRRVIGVAEDITERHDAEAQLNLLTRELDHRTRNVLTVVKAVVDQSLRDPRVPPDIRDGLGARIEALSRSHALLTRVHDQAIALSDLTGALLAPYADRVTITGSRTKIDQNVAISLTLALHELATNAMKYGALSVPDGHVTLTWSMDGTWLQVTWQEHGGPPVERPTRRGFGTRMIERVATGDGRQASISFDRTGVSATLRFLSND